VASNISEEPAGFVFIGPSSTLKTSQEHQYLSTKLHGVTSLGLRWLTIQQTGNGVSISIIKPTFTFSFDGDTR
jgi:hypothetical protein